MAKTTQILATIKISLKSNFFRTTRLDSTRHQTLLTAKMLSQFHLLITVLLSTLFQATTLASPVPTSSSTALHTCSVYVQLWVAADNIFDVYVFPEACPNNECVPIAEVETTQPVPAGGELPDSGPGGVSGNVGSFPLHIL